MQISSSGLYHSVFGKLPNVLKNSNVESTEKGVDSKNNNSNTLDNKSSTSGISLTGLTEISYKYKLMNVADVEADFKALGINLADILKFKPTDSGSPQEILKYKDYWADKANDQDTKAIIRIPNKSGVLEVKGIIDYSGGKTYRDSLAGIMNKSGGDLDKLKSLLSEKYGDNFSIETFEKGEGPTVAEVHQIFNGTGLDAYINSEIHSREQNYQVELQRREEVHKQKLMYNQTVASAVFSVGEVVFGSIND